MLHPEIPTAGPSPIVAKLRAVADLIEDAERVNVPAPQTVSVGTASDTPFLIMGKFEDVDEWGLYLETPVERYTTDGGDGQRDFIDTESDLPGTDYGIHVKVTTNRPHVCEPVT